MLSSSKLTDVQWELAKSMGRLENQPWRLVGFAFRIVAPEGQEREISRIIPQQEGSGQFTGAPTIVSVLHLMLNIQNLEG